MPKYRYQAADPQGNPASGEVEAAGPEEARRELARRGLEAERARLTEIPEPVSAGGRLSAEEAAEFGSQLARLAEAGLPLAPGLRAMAEEMPRRRVARALGRLADQLDAGMSLEAALEAQGKRFPAHVRGLILAGVETGRLPQALEEYVSVETGRIELRRHVWLAVAYPCVLFALMIVLLVGICVFVAPQFGRIFAEFDAEVPVATQVLLWMAGPGLSAVIGLPLLLVAAFVVFGLARGAVWSRRVLYAVPLVGPMWRWAGLVNLSRLMALLLDHRVPLPRALRLTAAGLREADLSTACRGAAGRVEGGRSLSECLAEFWQFPPSLRPLVHWAEQTSNPAAAFRAGADLFSGRVQVCATLLQVVLPPIVFVLVIAGVLFFVWAMFAPLVSLIQVLT